MHMLGYDARMRSLAILALAAGCSHKSAPTTEWCQTYCNELRVRAAGDVRAMTLNEDNRRHGAQELLAMVGSDPAINVGDRLEHIVWYTNI